MIISLVILLGGSELHQDEVGFDPNSDSIAHLQGQSFFAMEDDLTFCSLSNGAQLQSLLPRRADEGCSAAGLITDLSDLLDLDQVSLIRIPDALVETYGDLGRIRAHVHDRVGVLVGGDELEVEVTFSTSPAEVHQRSQAKGVKLHKYKDGRGFYGIVKQNNR